MTRSLAATGLTLAAEYLPQLLLGPVAGVLADRWDRRWLIVATNLFRAAVVAVMLLALGPLILADVLSYLIAAFAITATRRDARAEQSEDDSTVRSVARDLREGLSVLWRQSAVRALLPISVIFLAANASLSAVIVPFGIRQLGGSRPTGFLFAASYWLLFHSLSLRAALPAAVAVGLFGSMSLVIAQTTVQRVIPNQALGRVSAVFLTGEAAATLAGALAGPILAQTVDLHGLAAVASLATATAAVLAIALVPGLTPVSDDSGN
jgi:predicted MFS family arabinose efflux permease